MEHSGMEPGAMELPRSRAIAPDLQFVAQSGSTNDDLAADAASRPHFATLVTTDQTAGRGRLGREWVAPPGRTLAISVLIRPAVPLPVDRLGWFPLIAGAAMTSAVTALVSAAVTMKWPNDVLVAGRKISGILTELLPGATGVIVGAGLNLDLGERELPVPTATSLVLAGATERGQQLADRALSGYLGELKRLTDEFLSAGGDVELSGIRPLVLEQCGTIGERVRVELPGAGDLYGTAAGLDDFGRLLVRSDAGIQTVAAGDVTHLRYE